MFWRHSHKIDHQIEGVSVQAILLAEARGCALAGVSSIGKVMNESLRLSFEINTEQK